MKLIKIICCGLMVTVALLLSAPVTAQDWQSTSTLQTSGSAYSPQVTAVGATTVNSVAITTDSYSATPSGPRKVIDRNTEFDEGDEGSPIGDATLPLLLFAAAFAGVVYVRRRKTAHSDARV